MGKKGIIIMIIIFLVALATFFFLLDNYGLENIIQVLLEIKLWHIGVIIGITFLHYLLFAIRWQRVLRIQGYEVSLKNLIIYRLSGYSVSYLTPAADFGGEPVMAYLLSKDYPEIDMTSSFASVASNRSLDLIINLIIILISFFYIMTFFVLPDNLTFLFYITLVISIILIVVMYRLVLKERDPLHRLFTKTRLYKLKSVLERKKSIKKFDLMVNKFFHDDRKELKIGFVLALITNLLLVLGFWVLAKFLGFDLSAMQALVARAIDTIVMGAIPVPASIGAGEAGESAWFEIMGLGGVSGFSYYLILRVNNFFYSFLGLALLFFKGVWGEVLEITKKAFKKNGLENESD
ncbi:MAG: lysylphosphatidylglycerol synthase transmembrane domain-containing protein [Candidatus Paceibacterota bacterium]